MVIVKFFSCTAGLNLYLGQLLNEFVEGEFVKLPRMSSISTVWCSSDAIVEGSLAALPSSSRVRPLACFQALAIVGARGRRAQSASRLKVKKGYLSK